MSFVHSCLASFFLGFVVMLLSLVLWLLKSPTDSGSVSDFPIRRTRAAFAFPFALGSLLASAPVPKLDVSVGSSVTRASAHRAMCALRHKVCFDSFECGVPSLGNNASSDAIPMSSFIVSVVPVWSHYSSFSTSCRRFSIVLFAWTQHFTKQAAGSSQGAQRQLIRGHATSPTSFTAPMTMSNASFDASAISPA